MNVPTFVTRPSLLNRHTKLGSLKGNPGLVVVEERSHHVRDDVCRVPAGTQLKCVTEGLDELWTTVGVDPMVTGVGCKGNHVCLLGKCNGICDRDHDCVPVRNHSLLHVLIGIMSIRHSLCSINEDAWPKDGSEGCRGDCEDLSFLSDNLLHLNPDGVVFSTKELGDLVCSFQFLLVPLAVVERQAGQVVARFPDVIGQGSGVKAPTEESYGPHTCSTETPMASLWK